MKLEISVGEAFDKMSILEIKKEKFTDQKQLDNVIRELKELEEAVGPLLAQPTEYVITAEDNPGLMKWIEKGIEAEEAKKDKPVPKAIARSMRALYGRLKNVNEKLWKIEDDIRAKEKEKDFGPEFVQLARDVYFTNDLRSEIKRTINRASGSALVEEKGYEKYD